ncbi:MAG: RNA-binding protein S4 [Kordiimonas sp.]|nr:RNA-binding protein S4 [Kordiimonas sp.]
MGPIRLDKWLWYARFYKTRTLASAQCRARKVRLNGNITNKANTPVTIGDVLTFPQGHHLRIVRITAIGTRRGPATEAQKLYEDMTPAPVTESRPEKAPVAPRLPGSGRPTKAERRALDRLTNPFDDEKA